MNPGDWMRSVWRRILRNRAIDRATSDDGLRVACSHLTPEQVADARNSTTPVPTTLVPTTLGPDLDEEPPGFALNPYEAATEEWDAVCGHDQDVPHFSCEETDFAAWLDTILAARIRARDAYKVRYGWGSEVTIGFADALAMIVTSLPLPTLTRMGSLIRPDDLWSALTFRGSEAPRPDGTNNDEVLKWDRLLMLCRPLSPEELLERCWKPCPKGCRGVMWFYELPWEEIEKEGPLAPGRTRREWICEACDWFEAVSEDDESEEAPDGTCEGGK